jgi:ParB/RepB/Spo0J family partition protein
MALSATIHSLAKIPLADIRRDPDNPRAEVQPDDESIVGLAATLETAGLLEPVIVRPDTERGQGKFMLVAGERRTAAARLAGWTDITAINRADFADNGNAQEAMLIENLQRRDLDEIEEACGYQQLVDRGWSQTKIAERIRGSKNQQGTVSKRLKLMKLLDVAPEVLAFVSEGKCTIEDALELAAVVDKPTVLKGALIEAARFAGGKGKGLKNVEYAIDAQVRLEAQETRNAEFTDRLQKLGISVVTGEPPRKGWQRLPYRTPDENYTIPRPHKAACMTAHLSAYGGWDFYCAAPKSHPKPKDPQAEREAEERRERRLLKEAAEPRREFVRDKLVKIMPFLRADLTELLVWSVCGGVSVSFEAGKLVRFLLNDQSADSPYGINVLLAAERSSPPGRERIAVAAALAYADDRLMWTQRARWDAADIRYFALLAKHGYATTEIEQQKLDEATKFVDERPLDGVDDLLDFDETTGEILGIDGPIEVPA